MEKAAFRLDSYHFDKVSLNFRTFAGTELNLEFKPSGMFHVKKGRYDLSFEVIVKCENTKSEVANVSCKSFFTFNDLISKDEIPDYFYPNSIAIIFPYIRAFIGTLSLQANVKPILLPTVNLTGLTKQLKDNTIVVE
jgi:preprotein translocase subunit SecB